jgi:hypothetical protein
MEVAEVIRHAAGQLAGAAAGATRFSLHADNASPTDVATDGTTLWITDDLRDEVFVYRVDGSLVGHWQLDPANADASGITLNPAGGSDLWVVDRADKVVYHYSVAAPQLSGALVAASTFALVPTNGSPEGIADPPVQSPTGGQQVSL